MQQDDLASLQIIFNIFRQKPRDEVFETAKKKGVAIIVRLPLASGLLAGKYTKGPTFPADDHRTFHKDGNAFQRRRDVCGIAV